MFELSLEILELKTKDKRCLHEKDILVGKGNKRHCGLFTKFSLVGGWD